MKSIAVPRDMDAIVAGHDADFVVLDDDLRIARIVAAGVWCDTDRAAAVL